MRLPGWTHYKITTARDRILKTQRLDSELEPLLSNSVDAEVTQNALRIDHSDLNVGLLSEACVWVQRLAFLEQSVNGW